MGTLIDAFWNLSGVIIFLIGFIILVGLIVALIFAPEKLFNLLFEPEESNDKED